MKNIYREDLLDHAKNPTQWGTLKHADVHTRESNPLCGDVCEIFLQFPPTHHTIADARFRGEGCMVSRACGSMLMERIFDRTIPEWLALSEEEFLADVGLEKLTSSRRNCALLTFRALKKALRSS